MLENGAFSDAAFPEFGKKVVLFVHNTTHVADEPYPKLLQEKGFGGFPSLCFMDAEGNVVVKQGDRSVAGFDKTLGLLSERQQLMAKAKKGDGPAEKKLLLLEAQLGLLSAEQINEGAKKVTLSKDEQTLIDGILTDLEVKDLMKTGQKEAPEKVAELAKAGRRPSKAGAWTFWAMTLQHAAKAKDGKLAEQAYGELEKVAEENKDMKPVLPRLQKLVEQAKEK